MGDRQADPLRPLPRGGDPIVWDFGSAARHHQLYNPWLDHGHAQPARPTRRATTAHGLATRSVDAARRDPAGCRARRGRRRQGRTTSSPSIGLAERAARRRPHRDAGARRPAGTRPHRRRRPAGVPRGAPDQDGRRDPPAHPRLLDGRRRLRGALPGRCAPACARTNASAWSPRPCSTSARSTSKASTRSPASAARRIRTSTPTASSAPVTLRSSTSCTATTATERATTARSGRQRLAGAARRLQDLPRVHRPGDRPRQARRDDRRHRAPSGRRPPEFGFADERPPSPCSTAMASACRSGNGRSSAG